MEQIKSLEQKIESKDISAEFLTISSQEFNDFLRKNKKEPSLSITITWDDSNDRLTEITLIRLKAFLEDSDALGKQKRSATIRATEEQKNGPVLNKSNCRNAFASGVKWEKI